jgi:hypothetical protein
MIKVMHTDSGYIVRTNSKKFFSCFFNTLTDLIAYIQFSGIKEVLVDDISVSLSDAIEISKQLDTDYTFKYSSVVHRNWKEDK